ncbi:hypothetical protein DFH08DRAFT_949202 [Mycena albidolilacea]|uniref:Ribonuclease H1 N-terminal domain-containing protein n=1 Tax=Mycena albidolilacea TaxID=1033008 RepID=A0AAD7ASN5_9AGAR|nr:hypothetical protein DFH08DRAFT_949202 [Mycena albidolilacea]
MPCTPPFYPCPGHEDKTCHDKSSPCSYYVVSVGWVHSIFTNLWIQRSQLEKFVGSHGKSFKTWAEAEQWWASQCAELYINGCPPFEPLTFSLVPDPFRQPGPPGCARVVAAAPVAVAAPRAPLLSPIAVPCTVLPPAGSPFASGSAASSMSSSPSSASSLSSSESLFDSDSCTAPLMPKKEAASPIPKKERNPLLFPSSKSTRPPTASPSTRACSSPPPAYMTGRGIPRTAAPAPAPAARDFPSRSPTPASDDDGDDDDPMPATPTPAARRARGSARSILATPQQGGAVALAPPRAVAPSSSPPLTIYAAAHAAAVNLGLPDSKIMFSETDNIEKLQDWMSGKPFLGDDV